MYTWKLIEREVDCKEAHSTILTCTFEGENTVAFIVLENKGQGVARGEAAFRPTHDTPPVPVPFMKHWGSFLHPTPEQRDSFVSYTGYPYPPEELLNKAAGMYFPTYTGCDHIFQGLEREDDKGWKRSKCIKCGARGTFGERDETQPIGTYKAGE